MAWFGKCSMLKIISYIFVLFVLFRPAACFASSAQEILYIAAYGQNATTIPEHQDRHRESQSKSTEPASSRHIPGVAIVHVYQEEDGVSGGVYVVQTDERGVLADEPQQQLECDELWWPLGLRGTERFVRRPVAVRVIPGNVNLGHRTESSERTKLRLVSKAPAQKPEVAGTNAPMQLRDDSTIYCPSSRGILILIERTKRAYRLKRHVAEEVDTKWGLALGNSIVAVDANDDRKGPAEKLRIDGFRVEHSDKHLETEEGGIPSVHSYSSVLLRLFGYGISRDTVIIFTHEPQRFGGPCQVPVTEKFRVKFAEANGKSGLVEVELPDVIKNKKYFYMCAKYEDTDPLSSSSEQQVQQGNTLLPFFHQGADPWMRMTSYKPFLPLWLSLMVIGTCLVFSALFSGLNLGLMSLDRTDLKILCNTGTDKEKRYAKAIQPVRDHGNYLLCSILLGNVLVNSTFTILLDSLTSGLVAILCSTIAIVIFGEITPQAVCSRHGLAVGAKTIMITKCVMLITFPLSYPTSKILDYLLGKEIGNFYNRERLKELVKVTNDVNDLDKDEVNVISGVLELRKKRVSDVMTRLEDAFMLELDTILDFQTITEIMKTGFSRIPVYEDERENIVSILHIKDLAFVDPEENTPLRRLCEFYRNPLYFVFFDQTLDIMFREFKSGKTGHMAIIQSVNSEGEGDPFYETLGLITLEDVIEELIQAEIVDETDVYTDNRRKVRRERIKRQDFTLFAQDRDTNAQRLRIAPMLKLATFQYLSTAVQPFRSEFISETVLRRLLAQNIVHQIKFKNIEKNDPRISIITQGTQVDYFVLILEGRVEVTVGKENLLFESGPFTYFGIQALTQNLAYDVAVDTPQQVMGSLQSLNRDAIMRNTFIPDYTVKAVTDVLYIQISRNLYLAAKRATLMERSQKLGDQSMDPIDAEVEKLMHSLDDNDHSSVTPDATNRTVHSGTKASISSSMAPSPTTALNELTNNMNSSVTRNLTVLAHVNSSNAAAVVENNIAATSSSGTASAEGGNRPESDPSSVPLLPKP